MHYREYFQGGFVYILLNTKVQHNLFNIKQRTEYESYKSNELAKLIMHYWEENTKQFIYIQVSLKKAQTTLSYKFTTNEYES